MSHADYKKQKHINPLITSCEYHLSPTQSIHTHTHHSLKECDMKLFVPFSYKKKCVQTCQGRMSCTFNNIHEQISQQQIIIPLALAIHQEFHVNNAKKIQYEGNYTSSLNKILSIFVLNTTKFKGISNFTSHVNSTHYTLHAEQINTTFVHLNLYPLVRTLFHFLPTKRDQNDSLKL